MERIEMKLRNKKTGEITDLAKGGLLKSDNDNHIIVYPEGTLKYYAYNLLAELNEEWEDYKPTEPLIEDEKIREIIRPWTKINGVTKLTYYEGENCLEDVFRNEIHFNKMLGLEDGKTYTTDELLGEE